MRMLTPPRLTSLVGPLVLFVTFVFRAEGQPNTWVQRNALGRSTPSVREASARANAVSFTIAGKSYVVGGYYTSTPLSDVWEYDPAQDTWTEKAPCPGAARSYAVGFAVGGKGYLCTGYSTSALSDVWEFDPVADTWTTKAAFPGGARYNAVAFTIGTKAYLCAGLTAWNGTLFRDCWQYDPALDSWTQRADFGGTARYDAIGFAIGSIGYVGTGNDGNGRKSDFWSYDPLTNVWTQRADFAGGGRTRAAVAAVNGKGYLASGEAQSGSIENDLWRYDPILNSWTQLADEPLFVRRGAAAFALDYAFYLVGGEGSGYRGDLWRYDIGGGTWTRKANLTGLGRSNAVSTSANGVCYFGTGINSFESFGDWWSYDPATGAWAQRSGFPGLERHTAFAFSLRGKCYVGGGVTSSNFLNDLWRYDPASDTWTQCASFPGSPRYYTVAFTVGNRAYVGTGEGSGNKYADIWCYDPDADQWSQRAPVPGLGRSRAVAFSIGDRGYVACGINGPTTGYNLNDLWAYDPVADAWTARASVPASPRNGAFAFSMGGLGFIGSGQNANSSTDAVFVRYDPVTDSWQGQAAYGGGARYFAKGASTGARVFAATGSANGGYTNDLWEFISTNVPLPLSIKVLLAGAYDQPSGLMRDDLRAAGLVPIVEPYSQAQYVVSQDPGAQTTPAALAVTGTNAIVDWVLVEMRSPNAPYGVLASQAALLQRDGDVVRTDGVSSINFNATPGNYFITVRHRNHLAVMTAAPVPLSTVPATIDFTSSTTTTFGTNAQVQVGTKRLLWAGDATGNGQLKYTGSANDRDPIILAVGGSTPNNTVPNVYDRRDTNLDGVIRYTGAANDRDIILTNVGSTTPNNTRIQQLP